MAIAFHPSPRMRLALRYAGIAGVAVIVFVFALQLTFPYERVKDKIEDALAEKYEVQIGSVDRGLWPGRVYFNAVSLRTRATQPSEAVTTFYIEKLEVNLKYERAGARKGSNETKFFSSVNPGFQQIFKIDQGLDIMRNATVQVKDRVKEFTYKAGGGKIAPLFDGTDKVVSVDALHWYNRGVFTP